MTVEERLDAMQRELRHLRDRQQILDCVAQHARGCDRHDSDLLAGAYHGHGLDELG